MKFYRKKKFYVILICAIFGLFLLFFIGILINTALVEEPLFVKCSRNNYASFTFQNNTFQRFQEFISFKTISLQNNEEFYKAISFLERKFPIIHKSNIVKRNFINNLTLLYQIEGTEKNLKPYLIIGHIDVVPVNWNEWKYDPFKGEVHDDFIYGRGTLDAKYIVMGSMEALERILNDGAPIRRGFHLLFGHDEESMGFNGAKEAANMLYRQNIRYEFILDEGLFIMPSLVPGLKKDIKPAFVAIAEKGYLTINISVESKPGHSSIPPFEGAPVILSSALSKLDGNSQPNMFGSGPEVEMFKHLAPFAKFSYKMIFSNLWLFSGLLGKMLSKKARSNALVRTSTAVTMMNAGLKENVIPSLAWGIVNLRVHPSDTNSKVLENIKEIIDDDRVKYKIVNSVEPPVVSPFNENSFGFQVIKRAISQTNLTDVIIPSMLIASTDSKWFQSLTDSIYRFSPATVYPQDIPGVHGNNERISLKSYENAINFYANLILEANYPNLEC